MQKFNLEKFDLMKLNNVTLEINISLKSKTGFQPWKIWMIMWT